MATGALMFTSCTHTHESGNTCKSPAVRGTSLCFNHTPHENIKRRHPREYEPIELPPLHNKQAILAALSVIIDRLALRRIRRSEADTLILGLKFAARIMTELDESIPSYETGPSYAPSVEPDEQEPSLESIREMVDSMAAELDGPTFKEIEEMQASNPNATPEQALDHWRATRQSRPVHT
jgi:hypothetical protein